MSERLSGDALVAGVLELLRECYVGPAGGSSWFTDTTPDSGWFGTLGKLSAAEASRASGAPSSTIAAHTHHLAYSLEVSEAFLRGGGGPWQWRESWSVQEVDDAGWTELQDRLRTGYERLIGTLRAHALDSEDTYRGSVDALAHAAYHLGAVRQKVAAARGGTSPA